MASTIQVDIVSAEKEIFSGDVAMVFAPATEGEVGIAPGHAALVTMLCHGELRIEYADGGQQGFYVSGGILEVQPKVVTVLSDSVDRSEDLDEAMVMKAKQEAEKAIADWDGQVDYNHLQEQLIEASARFQAIQRLKGRSR